ncbi:MAG: hypothetical protein ABWW70_04535 [Thermoproteota archaeon]
MLRGRASIDCIVASEVEAAKSCVHSPGRLSTMEAVLVGVRAEGCGLQKAGVDVFTPIRLTAKVIGRPIKLLEALNAHVLAESLAAKSPVHTLNQRPRRSRLETPRLLQGCSRGSCQKGSGIISGALTRDCN